MEEQYLAKMKLDGSYWEEDEEVPGSAIATPTAVPVEVGEFERLMDRVEREISGAEYFEVEHGRLVIRTKTTTDARFSCNGGNYTYETRFVPDGFGVAVMAWDSSDFCPFGGREVERFECIVGLDGLNRLAQIATVTIAAKALVNKEHGSMGRLKAAIRALQD